MNTRSLSANALFHFTSNIEYLKSILINGLYPRMSRETIHGSEQFGYPDAELLIPMICFCDIPLSQVSSHVSKYGKYAIGLTKEWGLLNRIAPVLYYYKESRTFNAYLKLCDHLVKAQETNPTEDFPMFISDIGCFFKPYEGIFYKNKQHTRFYDEREWRYLPPLEVMEESFVSPEDSINRDKVDEVNKMLERYSLTFNPRDIKYVVINDEDETYEMVEYIQRQKKDYSYKDVQLLTTKIITMQQIQDDF